MPRGWADVFRYSIGWEVRHARRRAVCLLGIHPALFAALALCWGRWPWAHLLALAGIATSVSLWSGLYRVRRDVQAKVTVWRDFAEELPGVPPPPGQGPSRGLTRLLLRPFVLPPLFAAAWATTLVVLIVR